MADIKSPEERSKNMAAIRSKNTKPEMFLRKQLFARGYRYRVTPSNVPGHPDIYMPRFHLAIFVNGCFWHRHKNCKYSYMPKSKIEFWKDKFEKNEKRDAKVSFILREKGIRQLIVWECAIKPATKHRNVAIELLSDIEEFIHSEDNYMEIPWSEGTMGEHDGMDYKE